MAKDKTKANQQDGPELPSAEVLPHCSLRCGYQLSQELPWWPRSGVPPSQTMSLSLLHWGTANLSSLSFARFNFDWTGKTSAPTLLFPATSVPLPDFHRANQWNHQPRPSNSARCHSSGLVQRPWTFLSLHPVPSLLGAGVCVWGGNLQYAAHSYTHEYTDTVTHSWCSAIQTLLLYLLITG